MNDLFQKMDIENKNPISSLEAKNLMENAIKSNDILLAKYYFDQIESLKNFENEFLLSKTISNYYKSKELISSDINFDVDQYCNNIEELIEKYLIDFSNQFNKLKNKQKIELNELLEYWENERNQLIFKLNNNNEISNETVKLLSSYYRFDTAIKIENLSKNELKFNLKNNIKKLDEYFLIKYNKLLKLHKIQLKNLNINKNNQILLLNKLKNSAKNNALESFFIDNSIEILNVIKKFPNVLSIPLSLKFQTIKGKPEKFSLQNSINNFNSTFKKKMNQIEKNIQIKNVF